MDEPTTNEPTDPILGPYWREKVGRRIFLMRKRWSYLETLAEAGNRDVSEVIEILIQQHFAEEARIRAEESQRTTDAIAFKKTAPAIMHWGGMLGF